MEDESNSELLGSSPFATGSYEGGDDGDDMYEGGALASYFYQSGVGLCSPNFWLSVGVSIALIFLLFVFIYPTNTSLVVGLSAAAFGILVFSEFMSDTWVLKDKHKYSTSPSLPNF
jgi:hypothetical protein